MRLSIPIRTEKWACVLVSRTELDRLVGVTHARFWGLIRIWDTPIAGSSKILTCRKRPIWMPVTLKELQRGLTCLVISPTELALRLKFRALQDNTAGHDGSLGQIASDLSVAFNKMLTKCDCKSKSCYRTNFNILRSQNLNKGHVLS
jgi:hypothetical protein